MSRRDLLEVAISEYNAGVPSRSWKVVGNVKQVLQNLLRCPVRLCDMLHEHYNFYRHEISSLHTANLGGNWYTPGTQRPLKPGAEDTVWKCIMTVTDESCIEWVRRVIGDFEKKAPRNSTTKAKRIAQLDQTGLCDILDVTLVWVWVKPQLVGLVGSNAVLEKVDKMWTSGCAPPRPRIRRAEPIKL
jgi:hypothetical protein